MSANTGELIENCFICDKYLILIVEPCLLLIISLVKINIKWGSTGISSECTSFIEALEFIFWYHTKYTYVNDSDPQVRQRSNTVPAGSTYFLTKRGRKMHATLKQHSGLENHPTRNDVFSSIRCMSNLIGSERKTKGTILKNSSKVFCISHWKSM